MHNLDLRKSGSLSIEDSKRVSFLADAVGIEYNNYIGELIELNKISFEVDFKFINPEFFSNHHP